MISLFPDMRRRRAKRLLDRVSDARKSGVGVYTHEWAECAPREAAADVPEPGEGAPVASPAAVLQWCRETVGRTRRPWGIANFDLALAARDQDGNPARTMSFRWLAPSDLYPGDGLMAEVQRFIGERSAPYVAVALFSWGDATDAVVDR